MSARVAALARLMFLQASWNYERMQGVGFAWAALPLLRQAARGQPDRLQAAVGRSSAFFNANPYLAGAAAGAVARAEADGLPGEQVTRLRTALCGPLGALGDQLFWMGLAPAFAAVMLGAVAAGAGPRVVLLAVAGFAMARTAIGWWALGLGWRHGPGIGRVIQESWLPRGVEWAGRAGALLGGLALPLAAWWLLDPLAGTRRWLALALALVFYRLAHRFRGRIGAADLALAAMGLTLLWHWSTT